MKPTPKTILVSVTADDIAEGMRKKCHHCPVAIAIRRTLSPESVGVDQEEGYVKYREDVASRWFVMSASVRRFISAFDKKGPGAVRPFRFRLPASVLKPSTTT